MRQVWISPSFKFYFYFACFLFWFFFFYVQFYQQSVSASAAGTFIEFPAGRRRLCCSCCWFGFGLLWYFGAWSSVCGQETELVVGLTLRQSGLSVPATSRKLNSAQLDFVSLDERQLTNLMSRLFSCSSAGSGTAKNNWGTSALSNWRLGAHQLHRRPLQASRQSVLVRQRRARRAAEAAKIRDYRIGPRGPRNLCAGPSVSRGAAAFSQR